MCSTEASGGIQIWQTPLFFLLVHYLPWALPGSLCWAGHSSSLRGTLNVWPRSWGGFKAKHQVSPYQSLQSTGFLLQYVEFKFVWSQHFQVVKLKQLLPDLPSVLCLCWKVSVCVSLKLPGPERGARWRVWNRGAASSSNPDCLSGVHPPARLVDRSHRGRCWGELLLRGNVQWSSFRVNAASSP